MSTDRGVVCRQITTIEGNLWVAQHVLPSLRKLHVVRTWAAMNINIDGTPIVGEHPAVPGFFNEATSNGYKLGPIWGPRPWNLFSMAQPVAISATSGLIDLVRVPRRRRKVTGVDLPDLSTLSRTCSFRRANGGLAYAAMTFDMRME